MGAPGPEDPRYWERLRKGQPLDEWQPGSGPEFQRRVDAAARREATWTRVWLLVIVAFVAAIFAFGIATADDDRAADDVPGVCVDERGEYVC